MHVVKCYKCHIVYISLSDGYISDQWDHWTWIATGTWKITAMKFDIKFFNNRNTALTLQQTLMESM